ncbi:membrane protein [Phytophthora palmivora]|uniref:Membrane protein n=1 Tax=Phytophthora palmivora TaxID=4796 RepID=A0A2P4XKS4_9STRA|nr:membrane protein [Phytophthora palmivora]
MHGQRRPTPESTYASQAARWKQGFKTPTQQGPAQHQTDLENALVSELCSSVGSSSFPPREVLQKLLRYLHTLDHDYICELLDDKFESPLWQVKAKALSVLSALLGSGEAEFYKQYYSGRLDLLEDLRNARKDMLRKRADKVYAMLRDYVPPDEESPLEMMRRMQEEEVEEADAPDMHKLMHTSPVVTSQQTPHDLMMDMNDSPRSSSAPLPVPVQEGSAFSFLDQHTPQPQQEYAPAQMAAEPMTPPVSNSAFGFLSANGGEADSPPQSAKQTPGASAFTFMTVANQQDADSPSGMPQPSAPPLSSDSSSFNFLNQSAAENSVHAIEHGIPSSTTEMPSAFAFMGGQQQQTQQPKSAPAVIPAQAGPTPLLQRRHTVFDTLPEPTMLQPTQLIESEKKEMKEEEPKISDPIHDAFEGLDANDGAQALDSFDAYKPSSDAVHGGIASDVPAPVQSNEPLREVILEIEVPPGPMGVMLDRTIPDMTVIERFVPLPAGGRGYLELHPAICPGCALISINSIYVEDKGLAEVGPILGSLANAPKLLRFKKLMNQAWTANPSTLEIPYVPPPLEEEEGSTTDEKSVEEDQTQPESEDIHTPGSSTGEAFMTRLNGYSSGLAEIEAKLKEIIRREHGGQPVVDRRNQLAQLHGTVEKIQTQGIDSVIFGEHRPPNYEEVKQFRSTLVRRADDLARLIQSAASANPPPPYSSVAAPDEEKHPVSAFAFVGGDSHSTVNDPPLGISQLQDDSSFQFLNANANPQVANVHGGNVTVPSSTPVQVDNSYGFSFLRENAQQQQPVAAAAAPLTVSQAPTSPSSSYGVLSTDGANPAVEVATNVFAGLSIKDDTPQQQPMPEPPRPAPALYDTLTKSSHGRPMGLSDLEASLRSTASSRPPIGAHSAGPAPTITESTQSSFGFMSTINARDQGMFDSSSASTEPSSPTAFGFMRGSNSSSTTPTVASSSVSQAQSQRSVLQEPEPSMFSFISN